MEVIDEQEEILQGFKGLATWHKNASQVQASWIEAKLQEEFNFIFKNPAGSIGIIFPKTDNIDERINFLINTKLNNPESLEYVEKTENSFEIFSSEINMNEKISFIFGEDNVYVNVMFLNSFPVRGRKHTAI